jgi:organic radical activating enzyme
MNKKKKIPVRKYFGRYIKLIVRTIVPEYSSLYKFIYLTAAKVHSKERNRRKEKLAFQTDVVEGCNLNCAGCNQFAPLREKKFLDISSFEKDIKRIAELSNGECDLSFQGGEALMHPNITEFFDIARKYITTGEVSVITNGILLLKQAESFWQNCNKNKIKIFLSPYPIKLDLEKIIEIAYKYSVELEYTIAGKKSYFAKKPLNVEGKYDIVKNFRKCIMSNCYTLRNGKMFACPTAGYIDWFNEYFGTDFKIAEKDYIDIYTAKSMDEILDFVCKPLPFCRYCDIDNIQFGIKWGISKKEISEWI